jgi:hypothetical protein
MSTPINCVGDQLIVGQIQTSMGQGVSDIVPGTAVINGPCYLGMTASPGIARATCMIGPSLSGLPVSLETIGITNIFGNLNIFAISTITGLTNKFGITLRQALSLSNSVALKNALDLCNGATVVNGALTVNGAATIQGGFSAEGGAAINGVSSITGATAINGALIVNTPPPGEILFNGVTRVKGIFSSEIKWFDIPHQSRPGYRLVHACLEGPENGVYFRGHLKDKDFIEIPSFWNNLIDPETITVHFTPHKLYQELYVKSIEWGKIIKVVNNLGGPIDCDYVVYAERKDVEKLAVELREI